MRCHYCKKNVLGLDPITVSGVGVAHKLCYETRLTTERIFQGLNIAALDSIQFSELSDMVAMEKNTRSASSAGNNGFDVELF